MPNGLKARAKAAGIFGSVQALVPILVALAALIYFVIELNYMRGLIAANVADPAWSRAAYLFGSVEAIAFAAAGFLFGREVNRQRAEKAETRADDEQGKARQAEADATQANTKGKTLKEAIILKASGQTQRTERYAALGGKPEVTALTQADLDEVAELAKKLFP